MGQINRTNLTAANRRIYNSRAANQSSRQQFVIQLLLPAAGFH
jgi:hypothetical protein